MNYLGRYFLLRVNSTPCTTGNCLVKRQKTFSPSGGGGRKTQNALKCHMNRLIRSRKVLYDLTTHPFVLFWLNR